MSAQNKDYVRDSEIDNILAQVQQKRASVGASEKRKESPSTRKSRDAELDEIMRGLGFEAKKPAYKEPILLPDPAESYTSEERESVRAQMNLTDQEDSDESEQDVSDVEPEQKDEQPEPEEQKTQEKAKPERPKPQIDVPLDDMEDEDKKEPITLELPSIKFFTETEAQKQEAERQRIMEQAVREARNTIHSSAQFAIQEEVRRRLTEMEQEKSLQEKKDQEMLQQEPDSVDHSMDGKRFGDVEVDDAFRNFFGTTVATDRAAMDEVTGRKRSFLSGILKKFQKTNEEESSEFPEEEIMGEPADVGVQEMPVQNASEEKSAPFNSPSIEFSPYSKWDSITLDLPKNKITPKDSGQKVSAAALAQAIAGAQEEDLSKAKPKRRAKIDVTLTGDDFAVTPPADAYGEEELEREDIEEYQNLSDAPAVASNLADMRKTRIIRCAVTGAIAIVLMYLGFTAPENGLPPFQMLDAHAEPLYFLLANFILLAASALISITTIGTGFVGLLHDPTTDSFCSLAVTGALLQNVAFLFATDSYDPDKITLFAPVAALLLFMNAVGKWMQVRVICQNFELATSGAEHAAAFILPKEQLTRRLCSGLGEPDPKLLVSRPTALVRGFLSQSFSARINDAAAQRLSYIMAGAGLLAAVICGIKAKAFLPALSGLAGALCLAAPLACTLVYAVPAQLMQRFAARHKAVIPGPSAVDALGRVNTVLLSDRDLFPVGSVQLHGMKTFEKERLDVLILYGASMLVKNCVTLREIFLQIIQNNEKLLYTVESLNKETGYGFTGWIEHNRVIIGNRAMMQRHDIELPSMDYENKYTKNGRMAPIYMAVAGKLYGMFLVSYRPNAGARKILDRLAQSGISVLVQSDDFNVTSKLVASTYRIPKGTIKVLSRPECDVLQAETAYRAESEGIMVHSGTCASFLGGMRAAASAASGERLARIVQAAAIILSAGFGILLAFYAGLGSISLGAVLLYQMAWALLTVAMPLAKRP
ncbi:hypothetical protein [uncultured Ruthenibacterium sp.]|uniref:hypothetical protein n=1 Tax=uncultured Ruthenibacterium sp. TaxID=1905347 RepID=UPI00349EED30